MAQDAHAIRQNTLAEIITAPPTADASLTTYISERRAQINAHLLSKGAVLFRGFAVSDSAKFREIVRELCGEPSRYTEGSSERRQLGDAVYTSTEFPAQQTISLHNELSYTLRWPRRLCFCCPEAPASGGQTPLANGRRILTSLPPDLVAEFEERQICYVRNLRSEDVPGLGLSWQAVWEGDSREVVEAYCAREQISFEWRDDDSLWTSQVRPATATHPETGEKVWFNQADQFHPSNLGDDVAADLLELLGPDALPLNATFGDGAPIPGEMLDVVRETSWSEATAFDWQVGDFLVIDNMLVAHGRMPFEGPRRVLVAMA
ncbi:TauD/TfdA family dioxygenase [Streptomyces sp. SID13031]|uniref:TauD/TfdA family dioxygenase n=1 Tax=Streptomyces sp. SID13031 TaxID=2706046 RepID=UPI0013C8E205|nr:TauD/TfdA family dioxygenase [Streptomyces sp. SID13031]NEA33595.1 TauD/TfdA family dioxygenase [Streptomyces sp. SID13031]